MLLRDAGNDCESLGTSSLKDTILASPVASDDALYLRSDRFLYCIGKK